VPADVPVIGVRAILDMADESLDPALAACVDATGRPRVGAITGRVARRPTFVAELLRIGKRSSFAAARLGDAVAKVVEQIESR
jgi:hypothetical protein